VAPILPGWLGCVSTTRIFLSGSPWIT